MTSVEEVIRHRLSDAVGGLRGSIETALPMVAFVAVFSWREDLRLAAIVALGVAIALGVARLAQKQSLRYVLSSFVATAIAAWFALRSGRAEDAFLPGILMSAGYGAATLLSVLTRWPLVGFVVGAGDPQLADDPFGWRRDAGMVRVCQRLTWVLVGVYAVRLALMVPLYLGGQVAALAVAKLVLGWPLWAAAVAVMGWMLMRGHTPLDPAPRAASGNEQPQSSS